MHIVWEHQLHLCIFIFIYRESHHITLRTEPRKHTHHSVWSRKYKLQQLRCAWNWCLFQNEYSKCVFNVQCCRHARLQNRYELLFALLWVVFPSILCAVKVEHVLLIRHAMMIMISTNAGHAAAIIFRPLWQNQPHQRLVQLSGVWFPTTSLKNKWRLQTTLQGPTCSKCSTHIV